MRQVAVRIRERLDPMGATVDLAIIFPDFDIMVGGCRARRMRTGHLGLLPLMRNIKCAHEIWTAPSPWGMACAIWRKSGPDDPGKNRTWAK